MTIINNIHIIITDFNIKSNQPHKDSEIIIKNRVEKGSFVVLQNRNDQRKKESH